jgi:hypothetical protein
MARRTNPCQAKDRIDAFREHADLINAENKNLCEVFARK